MTRRASSLGRPEKAPEFSTMPSSPKASFMVDGVGERAVGGTNHRPDRNAVLLAELEVALIVRRARP